MCDSLHESLKNSVYHLPWFLDRMRFDSFLSSNAIVAKVFEDVNKTSGTPVTAVFDINPITSSGFTPNQVPFLSSPGVFEKVVRDPKSLAPSFSFDARSFTRQVKTLVDSGVMQCLFAATEGINFQAEAIREPRLRLFEAFELPISISENYLQKNFGITPNKEVIEQLHHFPRTFTNLEVFAEHVDRKAFVDYNFKHEMDKIKDTLSNPKAKEIYCLALTRDIDIFDFPKLNVSKDEVMKMLVEPNIFTVTLHQTYKFQFDATAAAAKQVVTCSEETHRWFLKVLF